MVESDFYEDCDDKLRLIIDKDPLMKKFKAHSKTNFKKDLVNTMNVFEEEDGL